MQTRLPFVVTVVLIVCFAAAGAPQARNWQHGTLVSMEKIQEPSSTTTTKHTQGKVNDSGKYSQNSTTAQTTDYDNFMVYTIDTADKTFVAKQRLTFPWTKSANVNIGDKVKFAIQKDKIYLVDDDEKEISAKIVKAALKSTQ
jgi:hypothetical protein